MCFLSFGFEFAAKAFLKLPVDQPSLTLFKISIRQMKIMYSDNLPRAFTVGQLKVAIFIFINFSWKHFGLNFLS